MPLSVACVIGAHGGGTFYSDAALSPSITLPTMCAGISLCARGFVARPCEGRGQLFFPLVQPCALGARIADVFIATSDKATVPPDRLRRCEPRRRPYSFFDARRPSWAATPTVPSACRAFPAAPRCLSNSALDAARGPRADTVLRAIALAPVHNAGHALGRRRGSPRLAGPGREQLSPHICTGNATVTRTRDRHSHRCARLHAAPSVRLSINVRMFGAIRPGVP